MINLAVAIVVLLWLMRARIRLLRTAVIATAVVGIASALLARLFPTFLNAYLLRLGSSLEYFGEAPNAVLSGRLQTWTQLASYIGEHPVQTIFGIGYKTLPYSTVTGTTAIADNTYLSVLIETGIVGLIALCALNIAILAACYRSFKSADATRSFLGAWFLCFWCGQMVQMLSADLLTYWRLLPAYFCVLALATRRDDIAAA
jgi:O-antigen ligase